MMHTKTEKITLLLDSARGQYIPRDFVTGFDLSKFAGIPSAVAEECKNPESDEYWDAWNVILYSASYIEDGRVFELYQDGDLWLICWDELTGEDKVSFGFIDQ